MFSWDTTDDMFLKIPDYNKWYIGHVLKGRTRVEFFYFQIKAKNKCRNFESLYFQIHK